MSTQGNYSHRLQQLREARENPSFSTIERHVVSLLGPDLAPTGQTIANYHANATKRPDAFVLLALADFYGVPLSDIAPDIADQLVRSRDLLVSRISWFEPVAVPAAA